MRQLHECYSKIMNNRPFTMPLNFPLSESEIEIRKQHHFKIWFKFYTRRLYDARNEVFLRQCLPLFEKAYLWKIYTKLAVYTKHSLMDKNQTGCKVQTQEGWWFKSRCKELHQGPLPCEVESDQGRLKTHSVLETKCKPCTPSTALANK